MVFTRLYLMFSPSPVTFRTHTPGASFLPTSKPSFIPSYPSSGVSAPSWARHRRLLPLSRLRPPRRPRLVSSPKVWGKFEILRVKTLLVEIHCLPSLLCLGYSLTTSVNGVNLSSIRLTNDGVFRLHFMSIPRLFPIWCPPWSRLEHRQMRRRKLRVCHLIFYVIDGKYCPPFDNLTNILLLSMQVCLVTVCTSVVISLVSVLEMRFGWPVEGLDQNMVSFTRTRCGCISINVNSCG